MIATLRALLASRLRRRLGWPTTELALDRLRRAGCLPKCVLDVGAADGSFTDEILARWPRARVHCFEPDPEFVARLELRARADARVEVAPVLVGSHESDDQAYFFHLGASSVLPSSGESLSEALAAGRARRAAMVSLDGWCGRRGLRPDFLKIDVQGYELEVLKGAEGVLGTIEVVFVEVNYIGIYRGAPLAADLVHWLAQRGFALHDVCNLMPRPRDGALWQSDMVFVRHGSAVRSSTEW